MTRRVIPSAAKRRPRLSAPADLIDWHVRKAHGPDGHGDCTACRGRCCTYIIAKIARPRTKVDFDEIRWYLAHCNVQVYIEDRDWHVQFYTPCKHLTRAGRCRIYEKRFDVCRSHEAETCEVSSSAYPEEACFSTPEELDQYLQRKRNK